MRALTLIFAGALLSALTDQAELAAVDHTANAQTTANDVAATLPAKEAVSWEFTAAAMAYFVPDFREYVIDTGDSADSFFYNWSELTIAPWDWVRFGMVTQRTRLYESDREIERGLLLGFSYRWLTLTGYLLNPDASRPTIIVGLLGEF